MKSLAVVLEFAAFVTGLIAAWYWRKASRVDIIPMWEEDGRLVEIPKSHITEWMEGIKKTIKVSGGLNKTAATWTAVSVLAAALSYLVSALAQ